MKRTYYVVFLIIFLLTTIVNAKITIGRNDAIAVTTEFDENFLFDNKPVLFYYDEDIKKYVTPGDNTSDVIKEKKLIIDTKELHYITQLKESFHTSLQEDLTVFLLANQLDISIKNLSDIPENLILEATDDLVDTTTDQESQTSSFKIRVVIRNLNQGEYNLIKNIPAKISIISYLSNMSDNNETILLQKKYRVKSEIEYPITTLRIKALSSLIVKDMGFILKNKYIEKKSKKPFADRIKNDKNKDHIDNSSDTDENKKKKKIWKKPKKEKDSETIEASDEE